MSVLIKFVPVLISGCVSVNIRLCQCLYAIGSVLISGCQCLYQVVSVNIRLCQC